MKTIELFKVKLHSNEGVGAELSAEPKSSRMSNHTPPRFAIFFISPFAMITRPKRVKRIFNLHREPLIMQSLN